MEKKYEKIENGIIDYSEDFGEKNGSGAHFEVKACIPRRPEGLSQGK